MTTIMPVSFTCPACHTEFDAYVLTSTNTFGPKTTDFMQFAGCGQPLTFEVHTCPDCGFTAYESDFEARGLEQDVVDGINDRIRPHMKGERLFDGRRFEFAALISSWRNRSPLETGMQFHKAAWCCAIDEMPTEERDYRRQAVTQFERAMVRGDIPLDQHLVYTYLIGELYRRIDDPTNAALWFDRVMSEATDSDDDRWWVDLATQQKLNPKEFLD